MSEHDDNHGHSVAAWTAVTILIVAAAIMSFAVLFPNGWVFVGGVVLASSVSSRERSVHGRLRLRPAATRDEAPSIR